MRYPINVSIPFKRESAFRPWKNIELLAKIESFNSLQTGKCLQTYDTRIYDTRIYVSIPFKRESAFRLELLNTYAPRKTEVSIPFKRESAFRHLRHLLV